MFQGNKLSRQVTSKKSEEKVFTLLAQLISILLCHSDYYVRPVFHFLSGNFVILSLVHSFIYFVFGSQFTLQQGATKGHNREDCTSLRSLICLNCFGLDVWEEGCIWIFGRQKTRHWLRWQSILWKWMLPFTFYCVVMNKELPSQGLHFPDPLSPTLSMYLQYFPLQLVKRIFQDSEIPWP